MKTLLIGLNCGEETCDGCELFRQAYQSGPECRKFGILEISSAKYDPLKSGSYSCLRPIQCLAAEIREQQ
jgi:hypothetical protein